MTTTTRTRGSSRRGTSTFNVPAITPTGCDKPVSETLPAAVDRIVETLHPEKIILFGSYAYGAPTPDSDMDLLVVMDSELSHVDRSWQVSRLLLPRPFPADILVKTPHELNLAIAQGHFFYGEIISKGQVLHESRA